MKKDIASWLSKAFLLSAALLVAFSVQYLQAAWQSAPGNPPSNNTATPINVSNTNQVKGGGLSVGSLLSTGEAVSPLSGKASQFRAVQGGYGFMIRNDGQNSYFLLTRNGDPYGSWSSLRPLMINNGSGIITLQHEVRMTGGGSFRIMGGSDIVLDDNNSDIFLNGSNDIFLKNGNIGLGHGKITTNRIDVNQICFGGRNCKNSWPNTNVSLPSPGHHSCTWLRVGSNCPNGKYVAAIHSNNMMACCRVY